MAGHATSSAVLAANRHQTIADQQKVWNRASIVADILMSTAIGIHSHISDVHSLRQNDIIPADVDTSAAVFKKTHFESSAPGIPTRTMMATLHAGHMPKHSTP